MSFIPRQMAVARVEKRQDSNLHNLAVSAFLITLDRRPSKGKCVAREKLAHLSSTRGGLCGSRTRVFPFEGRASLPAGLTGQGKEEAPRSGNDPLTSRSTDERSATELARHATVGPVGGIRTSDLLSGREWFWTGLNYYRLSTSSWSRTSDHSRIQTSALATELSR